MRSCLLWLTHVAVWLELGCKIRVPVLDSALLLDGRIKKVLGGVLVFVMWRGVAG